MSPDTSLLFTSSEGFPRVSGDEPAFHPVVEYLEEFSPRERG